MKIISIIIIIISALIVSHCKCHLYENFKNKENKNPNINYVILHSDEPFSLLIKTIRIMLYLNNIKIIHDYEINRLSFLKNENYLHLKIFDIEESYHNTFINSDGIKIGYQLMIIVHFILYKTNHDCLPIKICSYREFIKNTNNILSNNIQEKYIRQEIYQEISQKIFFKLNQTINIFNH